MLLDRSNQKWLRGWDYVLIGGFCALLFGYISISGRPMTLHESRLPECSREMMRTGNLLIPMSGDRPWLERPPLPHWIMIAVAEILRQHIDNEWSVRIPPALAGMTIVLLCARMSAKWFGRWTGLLAGLALASMYEFYYYSTLAEDDIFLALTVALTMAAFVEMEFFYHRWPRKEPGFWRSFVGWRPWPVVAFFGLLGLTSMTKGPIVGAGVILPPIFVFFVWQWCVQGRDWTRLRRYVWLWGWIATLVIGSAWHLYVARRYPDYLTNLRYDLQDTTEFDNPWWYYFPTLLLVGLPWIPASIVGLWQSAGQVWKKPAAGTEVTADRAAQTVAMRFLWCWALVPLIMLSIAHRKHHHYMVPSLLPWGILAAVALPGIGRAMLKFPDRLRSVPVGLLVVGLPGALLLGEAVRHGKVPGPLWVGYGLVVVWIGIVTIYYLGTSRRETRWMFAAVLIGVGVAYSWGQSYWPNETVDDKAFLLHVNSTVPQDELLAVNAAVGPLDFFQLQFYLRPTALLVHNISYLRSDKIDAQDAYVVGRAKDEEELAQLGTVTKVFASAHTRRQTKPDELFTLFYVKFTPGLKRYPPPPVSVMAAMMRTPPGPFCGPQLK